jgi:hypothetical protein
MAASAKTKAASGSDMLRDLPSLSDMEAYIRQSAIKNGIDPDAAVKVAKTEGLAPGAWQSKVKKNGKRERSYGPFQLYMGGGLGNEMQAKTGIDPSDPANWQQGVDYALGHASKNGWGAWYGPKNAGLPMSYGIGKPTSAKAEGAPIALADTGPAQVAPSQQMVSPSQQDSPGADFFGSISKNRKADLISALSQSAAAMAGPQQMPQQASFAIPAAPIGTLDPNPQQQGGDIRLLLAKLLQNGGQI